MEKGNAKLGYGFVKMSKVGAVNRLVNKEGTCHSPFLTSFDLC